AGMVVEIPREGVGPVRADIVAVEIVSGTGPPAVGLCLWYGTDKELAILKTLTLEGATLRAE
ncbi:MAG TPA: hypothetical protein VGG30_13065, partial [Pirellulales bacterium]